MRASALRAVATGLLALFLAHAPARAGGPDAKDWAGVLAAAKGQTVDFYAWAGEPRINAYIAWAAGEVSARYGVSLNQVKIADTAEAVAKVVAETAAGRAEDGGSVDLIWINGANFASMKDKELLYGPWADDLPNARLTGAQARPVLQRDFTVPVDGFEAPWGLAQLVFYYDSARLAKPPRDAGALMAFAAAHPGRVTYPDPSNFLGGTFLKQLALMLASDRSVFAKPADDAAFAAATAPLWAYLDKLNPLLWRQGRAFPRSSADLRQLFADGEIDLGMSFDPAEAQAGIASGEFRPTVKSYVPSGGSIGNASFLAIPKNAAHKAAAMVVADFLLSPEAQARKQDPAVWGGASVLDMSRLAAADRALFDKLAAAPGALTPDQLGAALDEPHPSWMVRLTAAWAQRYGAQ